MTPSSGWLARRNPTVLLAVLFAVSLGTLFLVEPLPLLALYLLGMVAALTAARVPWRVLLAAQIPFLLFGVGLISVNALSRQGTPLVEGVPFLGSREGLVLGVALALRGMVIGVGTVMFLASAAPREVMVSLMQHARVPARFAYALLAGHRLLAAMPQQWATIRAAQAVRAPLRADGTPRFGLAAFGRAAFSLLVTSIRSSERIALALQSRGLGERERTLWRPVPLGPADAVLAVIVPVVFVSVAVAVTLLSEVLGG